MSIRKFDLYCKGVIGKLSPNNELYLRCLEADVETVNNAERHHLTEEGKAEVARWKEEIDRGYEELKRRIVKQKEAENDKVD